MKDQIPFETQNISDAHNPYSNKVQNSIHISKVIPFKREDCKNNGEENIVMDIRNEDKHTLKDWNNKYQHLDRVGEQDEAHHKKNPYNKKTIQLLPKIKNDRDTSRYIIVEPKNVENCYTTTFIKNKRHGFSTINNKKDGIVQAHYYKKGKREAM